MKLVCFSDFHFDFRFDLPKGDILICCGDFSLRGTNEDVLTFSKFMNKASENYAHTFIVWGNHETQIECDPHYVETLLHCGPADRIDVLNNGGVLWEGIKIWGSPLTTPFLEWAFMSSEDKLKDIYDTISDDTDVVITHGPAFEILDQSKWGDHCGSKTLKARLEAIKPKAHIFGHIHHSYGILDDKGTKFVNCSLLNDDYVMINKPVVIDI